MRCIMAVMDRSTVMHLAVAVHAGVAGDFAPRVVLSSLVGTPTMLGIMAGMARKTASRLFLADMCKAGIAGDNAPCAVFARMRGGFFRALDIGAGPGVVSTGTRPIIRCICQPGWRDTLVEHMVGTTTTTTTTTHTPQPNPTQPNPTLSPPSSPPSLLLPPPHTHTPHTHTTTPPFNNNNNTRRLTQTRVASAFLCNRDVSRPSGWPSC